MSSDLDCTIQVTTIALFGMQEANRQIIGMQQFGMQQANKQMNENDASSWTRDYSGLLQPLESD